MVKSAETYNPRDSADHGVPGDLSGGSCHLQCANTIRSFNVCCLLGLRRSFLQTLFNFLKGLCNAYYYLRFRDNKIVQEKLNESLKVIQLESES